MLTNAPVGFGFLDTDFRYLGLNEPLAEINGMPAEDHLGRSVAEVLPQVWMTLGPMFRRVVETGEPVVDREITGQTPAAPGVERHWLTSIYPVREPGGELLALGSVVLEITDRKRAERATRLLAAASELFASDLDVDTMLDRAVHLVIPDFADSSHLFLPSPDGGRRVAMADRDHDLEPLLVEANSRYPIDLDGDLPTARALREGRTQRVEVVTDVMREGMARDPSHLELLRRHGVCSVIAAPLQVRGQTVGVLVLAYTERSGRRYQADDVVLARALAGRFAYAIESARLAQEAERATAHLELLANVGELLNVELDSQARLERMTRLLVPSFADLAVVHLADENGALRLAARAVTDHEPDSRTPDGLDERPLPPDAPAVHAFATGEPILVGNAMLCLPLSRPDGPLGTLTYALTDSGRRYGPSDLPLAQELARRAASALDAARRFEQEHATAETLQRTLLPERLPALPDVELTARYLPGSAELKIGGDWYDVLDLPDGRILLAIGDVVGHGVRAAASMGRIRNALQFCALEGLSPGAMLTRLNDYFFAFDEAHMATLLLARYDSAAAQLVVASAGHPPPLAASPGRRPEYLAGGRGPALCASESTEYPEAVVDLPRGSRLVLYTDGLVERRHESLDDGFRRLTAALETGPEKLDELADHLLEALLGGETPEDDVALLAVRMLPHAGGLALRVAARPRELARLRARLRRWLALAGAEPTESSEIVLAVSEAAANTIEHAHSARGTSFSVDAHVDDSTVVVRVRDTGKWQEPDPANDRGRGMHVMRAVMDDVEVRAEPEGTEVRMRRRLRPFGTDRPE